MFGYNTSVICENNNYVLTVDTNGSNVHDSVSFYQSFENLSNHFDISQIKYFVGDAAYLTSHICKTIIDLDMIPAFPYTRKGYRKGYLKKYEFTYDEYNDIYICPNEKDLIPTYKMMVILLTKQVNAIVGLVHLKTNVQKVNINKY